MEKQYFKKMCKMIMGYLLSFMLFSCTYALAFDGPTHEYVTETAIEMLLGMGKEYGDFYTDEAKREIVKYCKMPDEDENEGLFKDHFYNIATGRNFMGERMSALAKFTDHYGDAILNYKTGREKQSWSELGRSLHFLEDLITPVHSGYDCPMDAVNKLPMHVDFEKKCVMVQKSCKANVKLKYLRYFTDNPLEEIGKVCSRIANDNFYDLEKKYTPKKIIAQNSVLSAQKVVCGMLYRFYEDTKRINFK